MPKTDRAKFKEESRKRAKGGKRGRFSDWKKEGETVGFVHPGIGMWERWVHGSLPSVEEKDDGEIQVRWRRPNCIGQGIEEVPNGSCPTCLLQDFSARKKDGGFDGTEVVLEAGTGKDRIIYDLDDLAGDGGYRSDPKAKKEVVLPWIPKDADTSELDKAVEIVTGPQTLGDRIIEVVDDQMKARGEVQGDIEVPEDFELRIRKGSLALVAEDEATEWSPYPLRLKYKEEARPESKYSASKYDRDICPLTEEIAQIMIAEPDELGVDFERMCAPTDFDRQMEIIESSWECRSIPFEEFKAFVEESSGKKGRRTEKKDERKDTKKEPAKKEPQSESGGFVFCPECGFKNGPDAKFCQGCGQKLDGPSIESKSEKSEDKTDKPKSDKKGQIRCKDCGDVVNPMKPSNRCPECGEKFPEGDIPF